MEIYFSNNENDTLKVAKTFAKTLKPGDIVLLDGDLGAGKTVFTKGIVSELSGDEIIAVSPTFVLVNVYNTKPVVNHFDLYRIESVDELYAIGIEEYLYSDAISIVEWPNRAPEIFPASAIKVYISKIDDEKRKIEIERWVMKNLIIDCSAGMVLILDNENDIHSFIDADEKKHTDELLLKLDNLLNENNIKIGEIDNICVFTGPGSFTGVRVAISVAKGLAIGTGAKVFTCSNFDAFSYGLSGKVIIVLEGFSNNVYIRKIDENCEQDSCVTIQELKEICAEYEVYATTEKMQNMLKSNEINAKIVKYDAISCFNEKIAKGEATDLNKIAPIYLRASQAEIERNKKLGIK